ncbi:allophanate hydrolase subunit 1 [Nonomuraea rosea]|uniref:5-oxoprolinase subunit B family protein n=1 Tax=Nonomuraea rosea TaxID=638574 RepID=UPI0031E6C7E0
MRVHVYGPSALLVELTDLSEVLGLHAALRRDPPSGLIESVPAARSLLVSFDPAVTTAAITAADIRARDFEPHVFGEGSGEGEGEGAGPEAVIRVRYDGADLPEVTGLTGLDAEQVIRRHSSCSYVVALIGIAPGFYFLAGGHPALRVPRRRSPRLSVPKGSVALADVFTGVYPRTGPGGWQVIGHTSDELWDLTRRPSALLAPGTRVRFLREPG